MNNCTAIIINFLREPYMYKCVRSLRKMYPEINIIVGENGKYDEKKKKELAEYGADYIEIEWDGGVCKGRNTLMKHVKTDYVLIGDDDFYYTDTALVDRMLKFLESNKNYDLVGGRILEGDVLRNYQGFIQQNESNFIYTALDVNNTNYNKCAKSGLRYIDVDLTFNFFVARTKAVKKVLWDEEIKVAYEHSSFFIDFARAGYKVAFSPDPVVIHKPTINGFYDKDEYKKYRNRKEDRARFFTKYGISHCVDMKGNYDFFGREKMKLVDFCITTFKRKESLERLLFSIVKYYPDANIYVADDSGDWNKQYYLDLWQRLFDAGLKKKPCAYNIEYDKGLSYKRNHLVKMTPNKYKLILEDDFLFTENTKIEFLVDYLENNQTVDIAGGSLYQDGKMRHYEGNFKLRGKTLRQIPLDYEKLEQVNKCQCVFNFFLARQELLYKYKWDEKIKIGGEHTDFFYRLSKDNVEIVYIPSVSLIHDQVHPKEYKPFRARTEYLPIIFQKHNLNKIINFNGMQNEIQQDKSIKKQRV